MDWMTWVVAGLAVGIVIGLKRRGQVGADEARALLAEGAVVVDVRTDGEYRAGHLEKAVHVPLSEIATRIGKAVPDKQTPVLLHCLSGTRSAAAARILTGLGYTTVRNLGSYARARNLVG